MKNIALITRSLSLLFEKSFINNLMHEIWKIATISQFTRRALLIIVCVTDHNKIYNKI